MKNFYYLKKKTYFLRNLVFILLHRKSFFFRKNFLFAHRSGSSIWSRPLGRFTLLHYKNFFFEDVFSVDSPGRKPSLISPIPGLNPSGGLPSESVQFGFPCRIVVAATFRFISFLLFVIFATSIQVKASEQNPFSQEVNPVVNYSFIAPELQDNKGEFTIGVTVPKDHHAYLDKGDKGLFISLNFDFAGVESAGYKITPISKPKGAYDNEVNATVLRGAGEFKFSINRVKGREFIIPPIKARSQICSDITKICFLPQTDDIPFIIKEISSQNTNSGIIKSSTSLAPNRSTQDPTLFSEGEGFTGKVTALYKKYSQNFLPAFIFIFLAGILAAATPCVYPMIPITSAIIMKRGGSNGQLGTYHTFIYFFGIIWMYMLLGYIAGMTGGAFNAAMQSPFTNLFFALLFSFFGLAMLGLFDFSLGENFTSRMLSTISRKNGFVSTFLMGMTAGLIISPCVGPVVFTLLIQVTDRFAEANAAIAASGGEITFINKSIIAAQGGLMMGGFGIGIGIPFIFVGLLSNRMPKGGTWMEYVKYVLGLIILYIAWTYYMKGVKTAQINDQAANAILAGIVTMFFSIYLGFFRTEKNKIKKGIAFSLLLPAFYFMYDGLSQAGILIAGNGTSHISTLVATPTEVESKIERHENLEWHRDFKEAKRIAFKENKPIFIDFFAYWCANCLEFEKLSIKNKLLNQSLGNAVLVKIYDTDPIFEKFKNDPIHRELKTGLPYFAILKPSGEFFWKGTQYDAVETMSAMIKAASV